MISAPFLVAEIDDDGPGLDKSARAAAIERGKRLDESRPGSGLGLSIVVDLASIYGGSLELDESPLGGLRAILTAAMRVSAGGRQFPRLGEAQTCGRVVHDAADGSCHDCAGAARPCRLSERRLGRRAAAGRGRRGAGRPGDSNRRGAGRRARRAGRRIADGGRSRRRPGRRRSARSIRVSGAPGAARMACSAMSRPAPRPATAAAPILRPSISPAGRAAATASAANSRTEAGK